MNRSPANLVLAALTLALLAGCVQQPDIIPNSDPALRKNSTEFAADAVKRFPFKANAPSGGQIRARAEIGYMLHKVELANLTDNDWSDFEVWINQSYVVHIPRLAKSQELSLPFQMFFNDNGQYFPTSKTLVKSVQIFMDGKMYDVAVQTAD